MDGFITWLLSSVAIVSFGDGLNCMYPYHDGEHNNIGIMCQWEQETFTYNAEHDEWILKKEDKDDNCFEKKARKRYWEKRDNIQEGLLEENR